MNKTIFTITCNTETGRRQLIKAAFKELGWTKAEYTAELLNTLAMATGTKVASITKSSKNREDLFIGTV